MWEEYKFSEELGESKKITIPVLNFFLDIGERHIVVNMKGEQKLIKELGESKRIPILVLNFFLTFESDI